MKPIVKIEKLKKLYRIGGLNPAYLTLREAVGGALLRPFRGRGANGAGTSPNEFWALSGVHSTFYPENWSE